MRRMSPAIQRHGQNDLRGFTYPASQVASHLMCASKKGISAHQLMRMLDIRQYKSAWFLAHRIRYAMTGELPEKMTGIVEADETYIGGRRRYKHRRTLKPGVRAQD